ncbi:MAG TPA: hypothetical protein VN081_00795 [Dongiaceae bacterium]|nr:hypothetical protein [Dongiaceae bacterium]
MNSEKKHAMSFGFEKVCEWYEKSMINYSKQYMMLYTAYNTWYREALSTTNDRQALSLLKKRFVIWDDYCNGRTLIQLKAYMEKLVDLTQKEPLHHSGRYWNGEIENVHDWQSLIEYWYQVRCLVVHGGEVKDSYVWLAYETLDLFMQEIIHRAGAYLKAYDVESLKKAASDFDFLDGHSERAQKLQQKLFLKYIALPDIWQVDMQRVP